MALSSVLAVTVGTMGLAGLERPPSFDLVDAPGPDPADPLARWAPKFWLGRGTDDDPQSANFETIVDAALGNTNERQAGSSLTRAAVALAYERPFEQATTEARRRDQPIERAITGSSPTAAPQSEPHLLREPVLAMRPTEPGQPASDVHPRAVEAIPVERASQGSPREEGQPSIVAPAPRAVTRTRAPTARATNVLSKPPARPRARVRYGPDVPATRWPKTSPDAEEQGQDFVVVLGFRILVTRVSSNRDRSWTATFFDQP
jgi:hypothetical protein